jgi:hypothetical protein
MMLDIRFWWILGAAAAFAAFATLWVVRVFSASLNTTMFVTVVVKILREKNVTRALKLCVATDDSPLGKATKAGILSSISREDETNRPSGYRGNRPVSVDVVRERIRSHYDDAFTLAAAPVKNAFYFAIPAPFFLVLCSFGHLRNPTKMWQSSSLVELDSSSGSSLAGRISRFCPQGTWALNHCGLHSRLSITIGTQSARMTSPLTRGQKRPRPRSKIRALRLRFSNQENHYDA